jgi:tetratricopeptide (TPR) repeat protein
MTDESRALQARIDELWDFEDPAASEARFRDAALAETTSFGRDVLSTQIARAVGLAGRHAEALETLATIPTDRPELAVRVTLERGRVTNSSGNPTGARPDFEAAFELASQHDLENLAVDALHMVAIVAPPAEQGALLDRAIELAAGATDPRARRWLASLYNNAGWTCFEAGDIEGALRLFERALEERLGQGKPREIDIARWAVARALRALGRPGEALAIQEELLRSTTSTGITDPYVHEELAECLSAVSRRREATEQAAIALREFQADDHRTSPGPDRIARLGEIAGAS